MFKYENLWALNLAKAMPLWTPRLVLCPRASMMLGVPVLISSMKWMILNGFTNFGFKNKHLINRRSCNLTCQSCYGAEWGRQSQNTVEHWKQSIWNVNQGRQVSRQRQTKGHSYLLTRNLKFAFRNVCFVKTVKTTASSFRAQFRQRIFS